MAFRSSQPATGIRHHVSFRERGGSWPAHCVQDTPGAGFHPDLALPGSAGVVSKGVRFDRDQQSAFDQTGLEVALLAAQAPIDGFGVGTQMGVSRDAPALDIAYKLTEYAGRQRTKLSTGKAVLPGRKQVFRIEESGTARYDVIALAGETHPGRALLVEVIHEGQRRAVMPLHRSRNCPSACAHSRLPSRRTASL